MEVLLQITYQNDDEKDDGLLRLVGLLLLEDVRLGRRLVRRGRRRPVHHFSPPPVKQCVIAGR